MHRGCLGVVSDDAGQSAGSDYLLGMCAWCACRQCICCFCQAYDSELLGIFCSGEVMSEDGIWRPCALKSLPLRTPWQQESAELEQQALADTRDVPGIASCLAQFDIEAEGCRMLVLE